MGIVALDTLTIHLQGGMNGAAASHVIMALGAGRGRPIGLHAAGTALFKMSGFGLMADKTFALSCRAVDILGPLLVIMAIGTGH